MNRLFRAELLKITKRPMTWALLAIQLGILGFGMVVTILGLQDAPTEMRAAMLRGVTLPDSLANTTQFTYQFGVILLVTMAAAAIGSEYNWGTLRHLLGSGVPRSHVLIAKLLALAAAAAFFVVLPLAAVVPLSMWVAAQVQQPLLAAPIDVGWLLSLVARTYLVVIMPVALAFLMALVAQSQAAGIGAALGMVIIDQYASPILWLIGTDWSLELVQFFPFWCARTLLGLNFTTPPTDIPDLMDGTRAALMLIVYTALCVSVALLIFRRRDVRGAL